MCALPKPATMLRPRPFPMQFCGTTRGKSQQLADGIIITPSHNPQRDGGFKYNPPRRPGRYRCYQLD